MKQIELSAGTIEYQDTGGDGPALVLLHGLMMDAALWDGPIADLSADHRCIAPTLPLGAHRHAMHAGADLSLPGIARLVAEFVDRLGLQDITLVGNDTGGALVQLLMCGDAARVGRVVLVSCDAFDNFPPGADRQGAHARRQAPAGDVRVVHAANAAPRGPAASGRVRLADHARRRGHRPVDEAGPDPARDPPRRRANAAGGSGRLPPPG
jgi:pimeloyl-ACP methyl ester carboxylesterase